MNLRIIERLPRERFSVDVLFFNADRPDLLDEYQKTTNAVHVLSPRRVKELVRLLKRYDLLYVFGARANLLARTLKPFYRASLLSGLHSVIPHTNPRAFSPLLLDRLTCNISDAVVSNSSSNIRYLREKYGYPRRYRVVEHGVDPAEIDAAEVRFSLRERFLLSSNSFSITTIGSLNEVKNHGMLVEALRVLADDSIHAFFIGKGPLESELRALRNRYGLENQIHILTEEPEVFSFLKQSDLYVSVSRIEGLPGALLEAMACSLCPIATAVPGNDQVVVDGETGRLVPLDDSMTLASAIADLKRDGGARKRMGASARRLVLQRFNLDRCVKETVSLFEEFLRKNT